MRTGRVFNRKALKFDDGILKEHNEGVCTTIVDAYKSGENRVWIQHASGAGKSYIATKIIKNLADNKFDRIGRLGRRRLLSDYSARDQKRVLFVTSRKYLRTDFEDLNDNVKDRFRKLRRKIELTTETYYGLNKHLEEEYDMIIFDEMHHLGAKVWGGSGRASCKKQSNCTGAWFNCNAKQARWCGYYGKDFWWQGASKQTNGR